MNTNTLPDKARVKSVYLIDAVPAAEGGYTGKYWAPGLQQGKPRGDDGSVSVFSTAAEAELASARMLLDVLNLRHHRLASDADLEREIRLTGSEFAVAMSEANVGPTFFAYLYGTTTTRVLQWIDGAQIIPHPVRVLLALFKKDAANIETAEEVTKAVVYEKEPKPRKWKE